jgi:phytoene synthase
MSPPAGESVLPAALTGTESTTDARVIRQGQKQAQAILARGSKSFALAGALLGAGIRQDAAVLYAWCRLADDRIDRIDLVPSSARAQAVQDLRLELDAIYRGSVHQPLLVALHELVKRTGLPRAYLDDLVDGFAMDAEGARYDSLGDLDLYAYRVAGVVGLMMCHVLGVRDPAGVPRAAHLGMAMQLTNICRDVVEDWHARRQYLPVALVPPLALGVAVEDSAGERATVAKAVAQLLRRADGYYASGMKGLRALGWRNALAIGAAARIYRAIGRHIERRQFDVFAGRAVVSFTAKLGLTLGSAWSLLLDLPRRLRLRNTGTRRPPTTVRFNDVQGAV